MSKEIKKVPAILSEMPLQNCIKSSYAKKKRLFDICFSLLILLCGIPVFFVIALLIKITAPGSVFFASPRVGKGGRIFQCFKFRTMYLGADQKLETLLQENPNLQKEW